MEDVAVMRERNIELCFSADDGLLEVSLILEGSPGERAASLIKQGWSQLVTWQGEWVAHVPCHTLLETSYRVNLVTMECECPVLILEGPCVHLCLVTTLAQVRHGASPDQEKQRLAREALDQGHYLLEADCCITFHSNGVCVTKLTSGVCTCVAAMLDTGCVGALLVGLVREAGLTQPHMPDHLILTKPRKNKGKSAIQQSPIIIQTHTGLPDPRDLTKSSDDMEEDQHMLAGSSLSSKALLEKLYLWSTSKDFIDSEILQNFLQAAHDTVWGMPSPPTPPTPPPALPQSRLGGMGGNKKLRAVVRPVRRKKEEEEECVNWSPPVKMTRSGRTVRVKDKSSLWQRRMWVHKCVVFWKWLCSAPSPLQSLRNSWFVTKVQSSLTLPIRTGNTLPSSLGSLPS